MGRGGLEPPTSALARPEPIAGVTPAVGITEYPIPTGRSNGIPSEPDGNLRFTVIGGNQIGAPAQAGGQSRPRHTGRGLASTPDAMGNLMLIGGGIVVAG